MGPITDKKSKKFSNETPTGGQKTPPADKNLFNVKNSLKKNKTAIKYGGFQIRSDKYDLFYSFFRFRYIRKLAGEVLERIRDKIRAVAIIAFCHFINLFD